MSSIKNNIWKLYLFRLFGNMYFITAVLMPFFIEWGKLDFTKIMTLEAIFLISSVLFEVPTGVVADRYSRKISLLLGSIMGMCGVLVYIAYPSFWLFALGEIIWGISRAFYSGADEALLYDSLKEMKREKESKKIIGNAYNFLLTGILISCPLGSIIYFFTNDLRAPVYFMASTFFIAGIISLTIKEPKRFTKDSEVKKYLDIFKTGIKHLYNHQILKTLVFNAVAIGALTYYILFFDQAFLMKLNVNIKYFGLIKMLALGAEIIIISQFRKIENFLQNKKRLIIITGLITGIMFIILSLFNFIPLVIFAIIIAAGFGKSRDPLFTNYYHKYIPSEQRATILSSISMVQCLIIAILNPIVGIMADWSLSITFIILGSLIIIFSFISQVKIKEKMLID